MEFIISEIAQRIRTLRIDMEFSVEEMAKAVGCTIEEYELAESGETYFSFHIYLQMCRKSRD